MRLFIIATMLFFIVPLHAFELKMETLTNFDVDEQILEDGKAQMSIVFFRPDQLKRSSVAAIDKNNWSDLDDSQMIFIKGAFIVHQPITKYSQSYFSNPKSIKMIFDANRVTPLAQDKFKVEVSRMGISMDFNVHLFYNSSSREQSAEIQDWIAIADSLDRHIPAADRAQVIIQDQFSKIFDQSVTINKLIPYGEDTLVVSLSLARAKQSAVDSINALPFINAQKTLSGQLKDSFKQTYKLMAN